jgi:MFS family permease
LKDLLRRILGVRKAMSWKQAVTALKYPNYRLWFWSQIISLFGTWMESTALGFLIFDLTKSPAYLGLVGFATGVPTWLFMLYAGVIADRMSRRTLLMITQTAMMVLAFVLAASWSWRSFLERPTPSRLRPASPSSWRWWPSRT